MRRQHKGTATGEVVGAACGLVWVQVESEDEDEGVDMDVNVGVDVEGGR